jgi:O-antigen ligase
VEFKRLRGTGTFKDPNDLCLLLTMGMFIALYGVTDPRLGGFRWGWLFPLVLVLYALELTQSRGGMLSFLAGCIALFYARFGWRGTLLLGVPLVPVALVMFGGRMASMSASEGTGQQRVQLWSDAIATIMASPVFGVGMNEMGAAIGKAAHNSFLHAYAELGLFGGTLFFGAFFFAAVWVLRLVRHREWVPDLEMRRLLPYLLAIVAAYIVGILSLSRIEAVPTYLILAVVTATSSVVAIEAPAFTFRLDSRLLQRMLLANFAFICVLYLFVRVVKV